MTGTSYYFFYKGLVYKKSDALPTLEVAMIGDECGFMSREDALEVLHECQHALSINSLRFDEQTLRQQRYILDSVVIFPSNHPSLYYFLHF